jgi:hypothetical protein
MSVEMVLVCDQCRVALWLGHTGFSGDRFLFGNVLLMKTLGEMLFEHQAHPLRFVMSEVAEDYAAFVPDPDYGHRVFTADTVYTVEMLGAVLNGEEGAG